MMQHKRAHGIKIDKRTDDAPATMPFNKRPGFLIADTGNGCKTPLGSAEVKFPNPGPDVVKGDGEYRLELPSGECGGY